MRLLYDVENGRWYNENGESFDSDNPTIPYGNSERVEIQLYSEVEGTNSGSGAVADWTKYTGFSGGGYGAILATDNNFLHWFKATLQTAVPAGELPVSTVIDIATNVGIDDIAESGNIYLYDGNGGNEAVAYSSREAINGGIRFTPAAGNVLENTYSFGTQADIPEMLYAEAVMIPDDSDPATGLFVFDFVCDSIKLRNKMQYDSIELVDDCVGLELTVFQSNADNTVSIRKRFICSSFRITGGIADVKTGVPVPVPEQNQILVLLHSFIAQGLEVQGSVDAETWIDYAEIADFQSLRWFRIRVKGSGSNWSDAIPLIVGPTGQSVYPYIAYASDASGTDFTMVWEEGAGLNYIAFKISTISIPSPTAEDFAGLWVRFNGLPSNATFTSVTSSNLNAATSSLGNANASVISAGTMSATVITGATFTDGTRKLSDYPVASGNTNGQVMMVSNGSWTVGTVPGGTGGGSLPANATFTSVTASTSSLGKATATAITASTITDGTRKLSDYPSANGSTNGQVMITSNGIWTVGSIKDILPANATFTSVTASTITDGTRKLSDYPKAEFNDSGKFLMNYDGTWIVAGIFDDSPKQHNYNGKFATITSTSSSLGAATATSIIVGNMTASTSTVGGMTATNIRATTANLDGVSVTAFKSQTSSIGYATATVLSCGTVTDGYRKLSDFPSPEGGTMGQVMMIDHHGWWSIGTVPGGTGGGGTLPLPAPLDNGKVITVSGGTYALTSSIDLPSGGTITASKIMAGTHSLTDYPVASSGTNGQVMQIANGTWTIGDVPASIPENATFTSVTASTFTGDSASVLLPRGSISVYKEAALPENFTVSVTGNDQDCIGGTYTRLADDSSQMTEIKTYTSASTIQAGWIGQPAGLLGTPVMWFDSNNRWYICQFSSGVENSFSRPVAKFGISSYDQEQPSYNVDGLLSAYSSPALVYDSLMMQAVTVSLAATVPPAKATEITAGTVSAVVIHGSTFTDGTHTIPLCVQTAATTASTVTLADDTATAWNLTGSTATNTLNCSTVFAGEEKLWSVDISIGTAGSVQYGIGFGTASDALTASKNNRCIVRWDGTAATLYCYALEDLA